jgi:hypothetical protein
LIHISRGIEFFNETNRPVKFQLDVYEDYPVEDRQRLDQKIDALISETSLFSPPNRSHTLQRFYLNIILMP